MTRITGQASSAMGALFATLRWIMGLLLLTIVRWPSAAASLIVGGTPVGDDDYPAYALPGSSLRCGGTLVSPEFILTAAHCEWVEGELVYLGSKYDDGFGAKEVHTIRRMFVHSDYQSRFQVYDVKLLQLNEASNVTPVRLPTSRFLNPTTDAQVTVIGMGAVETGGANSNELLEVDVSIYDMEDCEDEYKCVGEEIQFCAGTQNGGLDSCQGDSGGPMFYNEYQVGVVSYGRDCGEPDVPAVYTRITGVSEWIWATICAHSETPPSSCSRRLSEVTFEAEEDYSYGDRSQQSFIYSIFDGNLCPFRCPFGFLLGNNR